MLQTFFFLFLIVFVLLLPLMRAERKRPPKVTIRITFPETEEENLKDFKDHPAIIGERLHVVA